MGENEVNQLYEDALYWHLIGEGYTPFEAEIESKRQMARRKG